MDEAVTIEHLLGKAIQTVIEDQKPSTSYKY